MHRSVKAAGHLSRSALIEAAREAQALNTPIKSAKKRAAKRAKRIGKLPLGRSYGGGVKVIYLPTNQAWAVMWHQQVLRVGGYSEMTEYARSITTH